MCTRAVYTNDEGLVLTGRSMDWFRDQGVNLWAFPRGLERDGCAGPGSFQWTSRYGSVGTAAWDAAISDGMNEAGLAANLLYLVESSYPVPEPDDTRQPLSMSLWAQYALDSFATVAEAVATMQAEPFYVVTLMSPDGKPGHLHLSLSDATGDSAIFEYVDGRLTIHHSPDYRVMTNSPVFDQQLALNAYWQSVGGELMLPGTSRAADRFVRASFYIDRITATTMEEAVAGVFSVMRNVSSPWVAQPDPTKPNISPTLFRVVADHQAKRYFYEDTKRPNIFWVDLADFDFSKGQPVRRLELTGGATLAGNAAESFVSHAPMTFLPADQVGSAS